MVSSFAALGLIANVLLWRRRGGPEPGHEELHAAGEFGVGLLQVGRERLVFHPPKQVDHILICIATPSGIYHGLGTGNFMSNDPYAGPILSAGTSLLQGLQNLKK